MKVKSYKPKYLLIALVMAALCLFAFSACDLFGSKPTPATPVHLIEESEAEANPVRKIDEREGRGIEGANDIAGQNSLMEIVTSGYKPLFDENSGEAKKIYDEAIAVLNRYIRNDFGDYERVHAIHDYLCANVEYDEELYNKYLGGETSLSDSRSFYLTGALLDKKAVCDGISKAFTLLCAIEGLPCSRIVGEYYESGRWIAHAWNKVKVDGVWYNVDSTLDTARVNINGQLQTLVHHGYFLLCDSDIEFVGGSDVRKHKAINDITYNPVNEATGNESYPVYENLKIEIDGKQYDALITSETQLGELFTAVRKASRKVGKLDIKLRIDGVGANKPFAYDHYIERALENVKNGDFEFNPVMSTRPYLQYPGGAMIFLIYA